MGAIRLVMKGACPEQPAPSSSRNTCCWVSTHPTPGACRSIMKANPATHRMDGRLYRGMHARDTPSPIQMGDGVFYAFLESPPKGLVPFQARFPEVWSGPGPPMVRTAGGQPARALWQFFYCKYEIFLLQKFRKSNVVKSYWMGTKIKRRVPMKPRFADEILHAEQNIAQWGFHYKLAHFEVTYFHQSLQAFSRLYFCSGLNISCYKGCT